jgi:hypothetical protein
MIWLSFVSTVFKFVQTKTLTLLKMKIVAFFSLFVVVLGLTPNEKCIDVAKVYLCNKYFREKTYECLRIIKPYYNHVSKTLNVMYEKFVITISFFT